MAVLEKVTGHEVFESRTDVFDYAPVPKIKFLFLLDRLDLRRAVRWDSEAIVEVL